MQYLIQRKGIRLCPWHSIRWKSFCHPLSGCSSHYQVSLRNRDIENIIYKLKSQKLGTKTISRLYGVSQRRVQQIIKEYRDTRKAPVIYKREHKSNESDQKLRLKVIRLKRQLTTGSITIARYISEIIVIRTMTFLKRPNRYSIVSVRT